VIFRYPDRVPLTHFVHRAKKFWRACGPEFSVEFSAPPEFSGGVMEKYLGTGWARTFDLQIRKQMFYHCVIASLCLLVFIMLWHSLCSFLGFSGRFCSYLQPNFPAVSSCYLPGFSDRICSYWQPNFPAVSGSYLSGFSGLTFSGTRRLGFSCRICCFWPGFSGCSYSGMGNFKKTVWAAGKLFWYLQRDFLS
jgi:hypothetical protein